VYLDENVAVLNKPAGVVVNAAAELVRGQIQREARPAHRLDAPTSGLMLFALNESSEALLLEAFKNRRIDKTYRCVLVGKPPRKAEANALPCKGQ
jgi:tRNA pseudouridine65 synthase